MNNDDDEGRRRFYRSRRDRRIENGGKRKKNKVNWFKDRGYQGVLQVQGTPGSTLANRIRERIRKEVKENKILIQEKAGRKLKDLIVNAAEPDEKVECERKECVLCNDKVHESQSKRCWWRNATYKFTCKRCEEVGTKTTYTGESKNPFKRIKQHSDGLRRGQRDNVLYQHQQDIHSGAKMTINDF